MARRIIRTIDGQIFSDNLSRFQDRKGYVLYKKGVFNTVRINKRGITSDDTSGVSEAALAILVILALTLAVILFWQLDMLVLLFGFAAIVSIFLAAYVWWVRKVRREINEIIKHKKELFDRIQKQVAEETDTPR